MSMPRDKLFKLAVVAFGEALVILAGIAVFMTMDTMLGIGVMLIGSVVGTAFLLMIILGGRKNSSD